MNVERIQLAADSKTYKKAERLEAAAKRTFLAFAVSNDTQKREAPQEQPQEPQDQLREEEQPAEDGSETEAAAETAAHPLDVVA